MNKNVSLKAMVSYEHLTKNNALELFAKENRSATDLVWIGYMIAYTNDNNATFEQVANMSTEEFTALMSTLNSDTPKG